MTDPHDNKAVSQLGFLTGKARMITPSGQEERVLNLFSPLLQHKEIRLLIWLVSVWDRDRALQSAGRQGCPPEARCSFSEVLCSWFFSIGVCPAGASGGDFLCPSVTFLPRIPSRKYHDLLSRLRDPGEILLLFETASPYSPGWSELAVRLLSLWVAGITGVCHQVCPSVNPQ